MASSMVSLRRNVVDSTVNAVAVVREPQGGELSSEFKRTAEQCLVEQLRIMRWTNGREAGRAEQT